MPFLDLPNDMVPPGMPGSSGPPENVADRVLHRVDNMLAQMSWDAPLFAVAAVAFIFGPSLLRRFTDDAGVAKRWSWFWAAVVIFLLVRAIPRHGWVY